MIRCATVGLAAWILAWASTATAAEYWVDATSGDDGNVGSSASPWETLGYAVGQVGPGDTLWARDGSYVLGERLDVDCSGLADGRIHIAAEAGATPTIDGSSVSLGEWSPLVRLSGSFVDFEGFEIANSAAGCVQISGSDVVLRGNDIHDCYNHGVVVTAERALVESNQIHSASLKNLNGPFDPPAWDGGLSSNGAVDCVYRGNTVFDNWGEGIVALLSYGTTIENNVVYDNWSQNIYNDNSVDTRIDGNFVYCTPDWHACGITLATETRGNGVQLPNERITVVNNIVFQCSYGLLYADWEVTIADDPMVDVLVANNTFVRILNAAITIGQTSHPGSSILNNLVYQDNGQPTFEGDTTDLTFGANAWFGTTPGEATGAGDIDADPQLTSPGTYDPDDYRILQGSPCQDAAQPLSEVADDFFDTARPQPANGAPDVGAHEWTAEVPTGGGGAGAGGEATGGTGATGGAGSGGEAGGAGLTGAPGDEEDTGGCSCRAAPAQGSDRWLAVLALLGGLAALGRRRRRVAEPTLTLARRLGSLAAGAPR